MLGFLLMCPSNSHGCRHSLRFLSWSYIGRSAWLFPLYQVGQHAYQNSAFILNGDVWVNGYDFLYMLGTCSTCEISDSCHMSAVCVMTSLATSMYTCKMLDIFGATVPETRKLTLFNAKLQGFVCAATGCTFFVVHWMTRYSSTALLPALSLRESLVVVPFKTHMPFLMLKVLESVRLGVKAQLTSIVLKPLVYCRGHGSDCCAWGGYSNATLAVRPGLEASPATKSGARGLRHGLHTIHCTHYSRLCCSNKGNG